MGFFACVVIAVYVCARVYMCMPIIPLTDAHRIPKTDETLTAKFTATVITFSPIIGKKLEADAVF